MSAVSSTTAAKIKEDMQLFFIQSVILIDFPLNQTEVVKLKITSQY